MRDASANKKVAALTAASTTISNGDVEHPPLPGSSGSGGDTGDEANKLKDSDYYRQLALDLINENQIYIVDKITMEETKGIYQRYSAI